MDELHHFRPRTEEEVRAALLEIRRRGWKALPTGAGTKLPWLRSREQGYNTVVRVSTALLREVTDLDPENLTVSAQAGLSLQDLQSALAGHGQWLPLESPWGEEASLGGIVSSGLPGPLAFGYGSPRDLVLGVRAVLPGGGTVRFGGKTVKNVAGYDVSKLFVGSLGTLGVVTEITFRLRPLPRADSTLLFTASSAQRLEEALELLLRAPQPIVAVEVLNEGAMRRVRWPLPRAAESLGAAVRLQGTRAVVAMAADRLSKELVRSDPESRLEALEGPQSGAFWNRSFRELYTGWAKDSVVFRLRTRVRNVVEIFRALAADPEAVLWMGAGTGQGYLRYVRQNLGNGLPDFLLWLRRSLAPLAARVDLLCMPGADWLKPAWSSLPLWDVHPGAYRRMVQIREVFDPQRIMAPYPPFEELDGR
ncbi:MAG: FAD-binding oxidoreductase [candidate division KSB1 bacterium]|nr:FAD-binding oxidoreductase [candidate division KSB1 bacterium]